MTLEGITGRARGIRRKKLLVEAERSFITTVIQLRKRDKGGWAKQKQINTPQTILAFVDDEETIT